MKLIIIVCFAFSLAAQVALASESQIMCPPDDDNPGLSVEFTQSINEFGINVLKNVPNGDKDNILISPVSLINPFNMLLLGTSNPSTQRSELLKVLNYNKFVESSGNTQGIDQDNEVLTTSITSSKNSTASINNLIAVNTDFLTLKDNYVKSVEEYYDADIENFSATVKNPISEYLNKWVTQKTNGLITQIADKTTFNNRNTAIAFVNAVYFLGFWESEFSVRSTANRTFTNLNGQTKNVPTMFNKTVASFIQSGDIVEQLDATFLSLPYKGGEFDFVIMLPRKQKGITQLEASLTIDNLSQVFSQLNSTSRRKIDLFLPKFTIQSKPDVQTAVKKLGLTSIFKKSIFGNMSDEQLAVSAVLHKTFIQVDEKGTKAAAVTVIGVRPTAIMVNPKFVVDHPFIYIIRHVPSDTVLFIGRVNNF